MTLVENWTELKRTGDSVEVTFTDKKNLEAIKKSSYSYLKSRGLKRGIKVIGTGKVRVEVAGLCDTNKVVGPEQLELTPPISNDPVDNMTKEECQLMMKVFFKSIS